MTLPYFEVYPYRGAWRRTLYIPDETADVFAVVGPHECDPQMKPTPWRRLTDREYVAMLVEWEHEADAIDWEEEIEGLRDDLAHAWSRNEALEDENAELTRRLEAV